MNLIESEDRTSDIAIIGMALHFPGADSANQFWDNIKNGVETVGDVSGLDKNVIETLKKDSNNSFIAANTRIKNIDMFDASFFEIGRRDAELMDPQHRVFLECAWEALENAGYNPFTYDGLIGMYAGIYANYYLLLNVFPSLRKEDMISEIQTMIANEKDHLTTFAAYKLNLKGPVITVQTACSTSLAAVHLGCESLLNYSADMIIAGASTIGLPQLPGYYYHEGGLLSSDGHCHAFDSKSSGTIYSDGVGAVILKRFNDAVADGDTIYSVIKGTALNNDGAARVGYTAPGVTGQIEVISRAQMMANVKPESITYIEAHGTGTPLGDSIELEALREVFKKRTSKKGFCAIGSVKANIGHLGPAAGVSGLIKTIMALKEGIIPPQINFEEANEKLDLQESPFYVNTFPNTWETDGFPRRAGVSSFGLGGTNVHAILEEPPVIESVKSLRNHKLLMLSAKTAIALIDKREQMVDFLEHFTNTDPSDLSYTLQTGRETFEHKLFCVYKDIDDAVFCLKNTNHKTINGYRQYNNRALYFLFPAEQTINREVVDALYRQEPIFRNELDKCLQSIPRYKGTWDTILNESMTNPTQSKILVFSVQYALAKLWMNLGLSPGIIIGEGVGHFVAACLSEVFDIASALQLICCAEELNYQACLNKIDLQAPKIPLYSPFSNKTLLQAEVINKEYWQDKCLSVSNTRINRLCHTANPIILEISSTITLKDSICNVDGEPKELFINCLINDSTPDIEQFYHSIGLLWFEGVKINWKAYYENESRKRIPLPSYPFQRERFWIEPESPNEERTAITVPRAYTYLAEDQLTHYVAPRNEMEEKIVGIWEEVLGIKPIGICDNFFEMGGNSLLGVKVNNQTSEKLNIPIELREFFESQTIKNIAEIIRSKELV